MDGQQRKIEIVTVPVGEAPLWVREAWIGLTLPLANGRASSRWRSVGVLTAPRTCLGALRALLFSSRRSTGYLVPSAEAIRRLAARNPDAANWWRTHTYFADDDRARFIFDAPACRLID